MLRQWIRNGGSLLLDGYDRYVMSAIPEGIGDGFTFVPVSQSQGVTTAIHPHPVTAGITSLSLDWIHSSLSVGAPPATTLADGPGNLPAIVADEIRSGRVIAISPLYTFDNANLPEADNRPFALQVFDWLAGPRWLRATPTEGVLAPGETRDVTIDLDATTRCGVTLQKTLTITTNDPLQPTIALPVELAVSGNRLLVAMADSLDFGWLYTSQARTDTLLLRGDGCEPLTVVAGHRARGLHGHDARAVHDCARRRGDRSRDLRADCAGLYDRNPRHRQRRLARARRFGPAWRPRRGATRGSDGAVSTGSDP
ncbi:MAG: hypothetical protein IPG61_15140 [bacterium]|nr:hypothetical protein [bacterium]